MSMTFFAHDGEVHETAAEETAHAAQTGITLPLDLTIGVGVILAIGLFWVVTTYGLKLTFPVKMLVIMAILLIAGVAGYQYAPVTSTVALGLGFAMALGGMFIQLTPGKRHQE
ncbi:MAG TPA: hypothetical protein VJM32_00195 [Candidatus Saccharimonadales bacterium]|nr:hypothetical protein [Candidatus Saccharimonadales bacterium]